MKSDVHNSSTIVEGIEELSTILDNIFSMPDLSLDSLSDEGKIHLDAYKASKNDEIIAIGNPEGYSRLRWFSLGRPALVPKGINSDGSPQLIKFTDEYFSFYFDMLTERQRELLKEEVKRTKGIDVSAKSFVNLKPNIVECLSKIYDKKTRKSFILKGKVFDFVSSPFQIQFPYEFDAPETLAVKKKISLSSSIELKCTVTAGSQIKKTNAFSLSTQEINDLKLEEKLFGDANETYISRDQLSELADQVYANFNIVEDYQMAREQFNRDFIDNLIVLTGENFKFVDFNDALESLSKFTLDFSSNLDANIISEEISNIFKLEIQGNQSRIVFDEAYYKQLEKQSTSTSSGGGLFELLNLLDIGATGSHISGKQENNIHAGASFEDKINELNNYEENSIEFQFKSNKLVPKSLKVAKLQAASFKKNLNFNRIKSVYYEAEFQQNFIMSTEESTLIPDFVVDILGLISNLKDEIISNKNDIKNNKYDIKNNKNEIENNKNEIISNKNDIKINNSQRLAFESEIKTTLSSLSAELKAQKLLIQEGKWKFTTPSYGNVFFRGRHTQSVRFEKFYRSPPTVFLALTYLDASRDDPLYEIYVTRTYNDRFEFVIDTHNYFWHILHITWIAFGYD